MNHKTNQKTITNC